MKILEKLPSYINESNGGKVRVNILTYLNDVGVANYDDVKKGVSKLNSVSSSYQIKNFTDRGEIRKDVLDDHLYVLRDNGSLDWFGGRILIRPEGRELYAQIKKLKLDSE